MANLHSAAVQLGDTRRHAVLPPGAPWYRRLWHGWQRVARGIGNLLSRTVTSLTYVAVVPWFAIVVRLSADPLALKPGTSASHALPPQPGSVEEARGGI
jgi:hypothetical protein